MAPINIIKSTIPGGCKRTHEDGFVEKIPCGIQVTKTRIFGIPVLKKVSTTFVDGAYLFGFPIKLVRLQGWVLYLEAKP